MEGEKEEGFENVEEEIPEYDGYWESNATWKDKLQSKWETVREKIPDIGGNKRIHRAILYVLILLIIVHIILTIITVETTIEEEYFVKVIDTQATEEQQYGQEICEARDYEWDYSWEGLSDTGIEYLLPRYRLVNKESEYGIFEVFFSFYDESEYAFADYEGRPYDEIEDELPLSVAQMITEPRTIGVVGGNDILLTEKVDKVNKSATYWVYAHVEPPQTVDCYQELINYTIQPPPVYDEVPKYRTVAVRRTLWQLLMAWIRSND